MSTVKPGRFKYVALILWFTAAAHASSAALFNDQTVLAVELAGPIGRLANAADQREEWPFTLRTGSRDLAVKVRARGNSRLRVCRFPPLRLNFAAERTKQTVFADQNKLKLVTHCRESKQANEDVLDEFAAYRIFNLISDVSYRVRLVRMSYVDTDNQDSSGSLKRFGFLIESNKALAERVDGLRAKLPALSISALNADHAALVFVFQYLIGNTDWSLVAAGGNENCCHNGDLLTVNHKLHVVPYDFDLSGLVNARYARPDPSLRIKKVTRRRYRGYCISTDALRRAVRRIRGLESEIRAILTNLPGRAPGESETNLRYVAQFFDQAQNEARLVRSFEARCL